MENDPERWAVARSDSEPMENDSTQWDERNPENRLPPLGGRRLTGRDKLTREQMLAQLRALRDKGVKLEKGWSKLRVDELRDLLRRAKKRKPQ